ncbi:MAG: hypothetical protein LBB34_04905 [Holosporales bacterium]|jgi:hypothetical protein|nr:hypothetical protein [Holosporales bacterium]
MRHRIAYYSTLLLFCCGIIDYYSVIVNAQDQLQLKNDELTKSEGEESGTDQEQNEQEIEDLKEKYEKKVVEEQPGKKLAQFKAMKKFVERNLALKNSDMDFETRKATLVMEFGL